MNDIYCDTNKIRNYYIKIIKFTNTFNENINKIIKITNSEKIDKELLNKFYNDLYEFGKLYEESADILEESILNSKVDNE